MYFHGREIRARFYTKHGDAGDDDDDDDDDDGSSASPKHYKLNPQCSARIPNPMYAVVRQPGKNNNFENGLRETSAVAALHSF